MTELTQISARVLSLATMIREAGGRAMLVGGCVRDALMGKEPKDWDLEVYGVEPERLRKLLEEFAVGWSGDEVVAIGAGIQGAVLKGEVKDVLLLDVTPLSLGIETLGGVFTKLIEKNTTIPTKKSQVFSTAQDNQNAVTIRVFQGEREMAADNKLLGQFDLVGIPPAPRGMPQIEVTFDIDANGIVHVHAKDLGTGKEQSIQITASSGLSEEEIKRMVKEAEANAAEDKKKREEVEARIQLDQAVYRAEKSIADAPAEIDAATKSALESAIAEAKKSLEGGDPSAMTSARTALEQANHKFAEAMYAKASAQGAGGGAGADGAGAGSGDGGAARPGRDDAVDADFEEVKE